MVSIVRSIPMVPVPQAMPGVPPGLEYLTAIDQLIIKQKVEALEALFGFETNNKYSVKNSMGQKVSTEVQFRDLFRLPSQRLSSHFSKRRETHDYTFELTP